MAIKTRKTKTSKGLRRSVAMKVSRSNTQKLFDKLDGKRRGHKVFYTIRNPNKSETNRMYVRVQF